jgi:hypothetical protein
LGESCGRFTYQKKKKVVVDLKFGSLWGGGGGGVLLSLEERLGWGYGRILGKGGLPSKALQDLWWGMGVGLAFGMIGGVEIQLSR